MIWKHDQNIEKEREVYANRIKEISRNQEEEIQTVRNRWNQELIEERNRIEAFYKEEIQTWQDKARASEKRLKEFKDLHQVY